MKIGVLASQGAFVEHTAILNQLGVEGLPVRLSRQLAGLDGLIIPGGESTSISKLMLDYNLADKIKKLASNGLPIFGTGVSARQEKLLVSAFHPELTDDLRFHQYFLDIVTGER